MLLILLRGIQSEVKCEDQDHIVDRYCGGMYKA